MTVLYVAFKLFCTGNWEETA